MPREKSPLAGKAVIIKTGEMAGHEITIEDWWENVSGKSWMTPEILPVVVIQYAARVHRDKLPINDNVLYGKIADVGCLVHASEFR